MSRNWQQHTAKVQIEALAQEIRNELNINNIDRLADYLRLADDEKLTADQKAGVGDQRLDARQRLRHPEFRRRDVAGGCARRGPGLPALDESGGTRRDPQAPEVSRRRTLANVAKILATMKPPLDIEIPQEGVWGLLERSIPGVGDEPEFRYLVQIPPEYDPSRRYPCIVTLHGAATTPQDQIDWWAGRLGCGEEAARRARPRVTATS